MNEPLTQGPYQATTPVAYIAHESEEMVHVRRAELRYWATEALEVVKNPLEGAGAWATTCAGISVAAGLSALGLLATEDKTHKVPSGVYLVMLSVTLAFGVAAAFCWWVDRKQREMRTSRAESLADQIKAADTRSPRDPDAAAHVGLGAWLDARSADIRKLKGQLETQLARPAVEHDSIALTEQMFWDVNREVLLKLHVTAPECVDYYKQNPDWFATSITRIRPEEFADVVRVMDYTLDQIAHIREQVT